MSNEFMDTVHLVALKDNQLFKLNRKVEEMQKSLEWYADEKNWGSIEEYGAFVSDGGEKARKALKGDNQ